MCCGSHGTYVGASTEEELQRALPALRYADKPSDIGDVVVPSDSRLRCWCRGYGNTEDMMPDDVSRAGVTACRCDRQITGEDMRCNRCREVCDLAWTAAFAE